MKRSRFGRTLGTLTLIRVLALLSSAQAATPVTPDASPEARALLNYLYSLKGKKTLSGQMYAPWGHDEIKTVHDITGKYPALRGEDYINEGQNERENQLAMEWWKAGGIPTIMWHWGAPSKGEGYEQSKMAIDIDQCFVPRTPEHTAMWADLKRIADHLTVLRDAHVPILWRPMHECDGNWFWYGKQGGEKFVRVWRTMFDFFAHERKLNNLIWVLCHTGNPKAEWDPGRQYYDLAGADTYARGPQDALYKKVVAIHGDTMPIPYHECGTLPDPDESFQKGAPWAWWMLWHTSYLNNHNKDELKRIYNHDLVITRDEIPDIMNYVDSESGIARTPAVAKVAQSAPVGLPIAAAHACQTVVLKGDAGGKRFDGIGAVSGGGATSVLLKDYPEPRRSQILDLLFKPNFGASMSALMVEVPGDGNSTQGAEPSHMHTRNDLNFYRGYEWWLLSEAKKRNPALTLDACAWGAPGWVGNGNFWSQDMADYYVKWIQGLKAAHGLDLDAIGCRNEKGYNLDFAKRFRATLNAAGLQKVKLHGFDNWGRQKFEWMGQLSKDADLRNSIDIISNHTMSEIPIPPDIQKLAASLGKPLWNSEEHVYKKGFDCEISLVKAFNDNFIDSGVTKIINWYLAGSVYPVEPYPEDPAALMANSPWSGHYQPREVLWGYAHYGQFSRVGWTYLNGGSGKLDGGGSFVTLKSPGKDYTVIFETNGAAAPQEVTFQVGGGLSQRSLCVWRSDAKAQFVPQAGIVPQNGVFTLMLEPNTIVSISTTRGQRKGSFPNVPAATKFPFPYYETFDSYPSGQQVGYLPHYTADIAGVFELADRPDKTGKCLRQVVAQKPQSWAPEWMPYTIIGDRDWSDYEVSADVLLDNGGWAGVMGRINEVGSGYGTDPKGYYLRLGADGTYALIAVNGRAGAEDLGDKEHQDRLRAEAAAAAAAGTTAPTDRGEKSVGFGTLRGFAPNLWHNLKLRFVGTTITGFIDGAQVLSVQNTRFARGMAGLVTGDTNTRNTAYFDNLLINTVGGATPLPTTFARKQLPLYKR